MRWIAVVLLLLAPVVHAGPFDPPPAEAFQVDAAPGARARYAESLALVGATLAEDPADAAAWRRAADLLERFDRAPELTPMLRKELAKEHPPAAQAALRGALGHLLLLEARRFGGGIIIFGPGLRQRRPMRLTDQAKKLLDEAAKHLAWALAADAGSIEVREDLAEVLERLDEEKNKEEIARLRKEAGQLRLRAMAAGGAAHERPKPVDRMAEVARLRAEATVLEQDPEDPDHGAARRLRERALVLEFATHTIPFEYEPTIFEAVSLLASSRLVETNLTRTFLARDGKVKTVPPQYYPAKHARKLELIKTLALDPSDAAGAALLGLVRQETNPELVAAAIEGLGRNNHPGVRKHLPALLDTNLLSEDASFDAPAQRQLVALAVAWKLKEAAPVLARYVALDTDLYCPLDLAWALGEIGSPEHVAALRAIAVDPARDVWYRRQAVVAIGKIAPEALAELPAEPRIALALAAARYRTTPTDDLRGRILTAIGEEHETDDAARYCVELGIREAIPGLEAFLLKHADHYAATDIRASLEALRQLQ